MDDFKNTHIFYGREIVKMSDGGQIALDWAENETSKDHPDSATRPTVLLLPGLTGNNVLTMYINVIKFYFN